MGYRESNKMGSGAALVTLRYILQSSTFIRPAVVISFPLKIKFDVVMKLK